MEKKTIDGWLNSKKALDVYLTNVPCEICQDLYHYIFDATGGAYVQNGITQGLEPVSHVEGSDKKVLTYSTTREIGDKYYSLGVLPEFKE